MSAPKPKTNGPKTNGPKTSEPIINLPRARQLMAERGIDAAIAYGGANFQYLTGFQNYFDYPGTSYAVLAADARVAPFMLVANWVADAAREASHIRDIATFPLWLEIADLEAMRAGTMTRVPKPLRFDLEGNVKKLATELERRELARGTLAIELGAVSTLVFEMLRRHLPEARWVNGSELFFALRAIKTAAEVDRIREATRFAEDGLRHLTRSQLVGRDVNGLKLLYEQACVARALAAPDCGFQGIRVTASIGGIVSPTLAGGPRVREEDLIFFDCGASILGYGSDTGRTLALRKQSAEARRIMDALRAGIEAAFALVKPGARMCDIFEAGHEAVRANGLPWYTRGHIGHTMGHGMGELPPFLAPQETRTLEPGMVVALETPLYIRGLGGFQIEECFVVTATGYELLTSLPRDFLMVGG